MQFCLPLSFDSNDTPTPEWSNPPKGSDKISQVLTNAKSSCPRNNDLPKVVTSRVISLFAKNNG